jgi:hypothetical protein
LAPVTIGALREDWYAGASAGIGRAAGRKSYRASVLRAYSTAWRLRLKPEFATVRVDALTVPRVPHHIDNLVRRGSPPTP